MTIFDTLKINSSGFCLYIANFSEEIPLNIEEISFLVKPVVETIFPIRSNFNDGGITLFTTLSSFVDFTLKSDPDSKLSFDVYDVASPSVILKYT